MTVTSTTTSVERPGNGSATTFSFAPLAIYSDDQLEVVKRDASGNLTTLELGTGASKYAVVATFDEESAVPGSVRYPESGGTPLASGEYLVIRRVISATQEMNIENQGGYQPKTLERALDLAVMRDIQLQEQLDRAISVPFGSDVSPENYYDEILAARDEAVAAAAASVAVPSNTPILAAGSTTPRTLATRFSDELNVDDYGAAGDGVTDDTAAFQAAIDAAFARGGGTVTFTRRHLISSDLTIKKYCTLRGPLGLADELLPASSADYDSKAGVLFVSPTATLKPDDGASVEHAIILREGLNLPFVDEAAATAGLAAFSGVAVTPIGAGVLIHHCLIFGFAQAISSVGNERPRIQYVQGDCLSGIDIQDCTDVGYVDLCHFWPWTTTHRGFSNTLLTRPGVAFRFKDVGDWNKFTNCFSFGYATGFQAQNVNDATFLGCGADYVGALASTSIGFHVDGDSDRVRLIGCQAAAQGTGVKVSLTANHRKVQIEGGTLWDNDTHQISVTGGRAQISGVSMVRGAVGIYAGSGAYSLDVNGVSFTSTTTPLDIAAEVLSKSNIQNVNLYDAANTSIGEYRTLVNTARNNYRTSYNSSDTIGIADFMRKGAGTAESPSGVSANDNPYILTAQVYNGSSFTTIANMIMKAVGTQSGTSTPGQVSFSTTPNSTTSTVERVVLDSSGNFKPVTDNTYGLGVSGLRWKDVWAANGTIQTSDARQKTDIAESELGLEFVKRLNPVSFKWKEGSKKVIGQKMIGPDGTIYEPGQSYPEGSVQGEVVTESVPGTRRHYGLLAQEVKAACDELGVDFGGWVLSDLSDPESAQALRYDQFISVLIKSVQELETQVRGLKEELAELKGN